jgi:hypothetical protein
VPPVELVVLARVVRLELAQCFLDSDDGRRAHEQMDAIGEPDETEESVLELRAVVDERHAEKLEGPFAREERFPRVRVHRNGNQRSG